MKAKRVDLVIRTRRGVCIIADDAYDLRELICSYRRRRRDPALGKYAFLTHSIVSGASELASYSEYTLYLLGADVYKSPLSQYERARLRGYKYES